MVGTMVHERVSDKYSLILYQKEKDDDQKEDEHTCSPERGTLNIRIRRVFRADDMGVTVSRYHYNREA